MNKSKLEEQVKKLKKENERLDKTVFELEQRLDIVQSVVTKIVEGNKKDISKDIEYICLKHFVGAQEYYDMLMLPCHVERRYRQTGDYPTFQEYHELLIKTLKILEEDIEDFSNEITLNLVKNQTELGDLTVFNKILEDYNKNKK